VNHWALSEHITRSGPVTGRANHLGILAGGARGLVGRVTAAASEIAEWPLLRHIWPVCVRLAMVWRMAGL